MTVLSEPQPTPSWSSCLLQLSKVVVLNGVDTVGNTRGASSAPLAEDDLPGCNTRVASRCAVISAGCSALRSSARSCSSRPAQYIGPAESRCKRGGQEFRCSSAPFAGLPCVLLVCSGFRPVRRQHARCVPRPAEPRPGRSSLCMPWPHAEPRPHAEPWPPSATLMWRTRYLLKLLWPASK